LSPMLSFSDAITVDTCENAKLWLNCQRADDPSVANVVCSLSAYCLSEETDTVKFLDENCASLLAPAIAPACICANGGSCPQNDGVCVCPSGFSGYKCETTNAVADVIAASLVLEGSCDDLAAHHAAAYIDMLAQYTNLPSLWIHFTLCAPHPAKANLMFINFKIFITNPVFVEQTITQINTMVTQVGGSSPLLQVLEVFVNKAENVNIIIDCSGKPYELADASAAATSDQCGVCHGTNTCLDCAGTPNGLAMLDACSVCNGFAADSTECWNNENEIEPGLLPDDSESSNSDSSDSEDSDQSGSNGNSANPRNRPHSRGRRFRHRRRSVRVVAIAAAVLLPLVTLLLLGALCCKCRRERRQRVVMATVVTGKDGIVMAIPITPSRVHAVDAVMMKV